MNNQVKLGKLAGDYMNATMENWQKSCFPRLSSSWGKSVVRLVLFALTAPLVLAACGKPPALINRYVLEYPPPAVTRVSQLDTGIKVELFAVDEAINRPEMVYKVNPYKTGVYQYNRWRTDPGYLVTDYLTRDLRDSRLFKAVFPYDRSGQARFHLEGGVVEFQENDMPGPWQAALTLNITLLDTDKENIAERVVFQRTYQAQEPMPARTPQGLAEAMSSAMQQLSKKIIDDVYRAVKARSGADKGPPDEYGRKAGNPSFAG
jgi:cholesterol transport system auxiliary component